MEQGRNRLARGNISRLGGGTLDAFRVDPLPGVLPTTVARSGAVSQARQSQARPVA